MIVTDLSASRVHTASKCMRAYEFQHIHKLPEPQEAARTVFGTVVHRAVQNWYAGPDYRSMHLSYYVDALWWEHLPRDVGIALRHLLAAERDVEQVAQLIKVCRPDIKSPRTTKDFLTSSQHKMFEDARDELLSAQNKCEEMAWPQNENAFQAYAKSIDIADKLELRWREKPAPVAVEREFWVELPNVELRIHGFIDQIRMDPDEHGEVHVLGHDLKTGQQLMSQMEMFIQAYLYNEACYQLEELPLPRAWEFLFARSMTPQIGRIDRGRHRPLAERILTSAKRKIESEDWTPSYGFWCKSCSFRDICEKEIGLWSTDETKQTPVRVADTSRRQFVGPHTPACIAGEIDAECPCETPLRRQTV